LATVSGSSQVTVVPETFPPPDCVTAPGKVTETLVSTTPLKDVLVGWAPPGPPDGAAGASDGAGAGASGANGAGGSGDAGESGNAAPPADGPAQEVSSIPTPAQQLSDADKTYFDALTAGGIKVEGAENQMIGAAQVVCQNQFPQAVQAVGGQLVEQKRTSLSPEETVSLIETSARKAYCS